MNDIPTFKTDWQYFWELNERKHVPFGLLRRMMDVMPAALFASGMASLFMKMMKNE